MNKNPHVDAKNTSDLIKILESEQNYIKQLIAKNKENKEDFKDTYKLQYINDLHLITASLLELEIHIQHNKERIDIKIDGDWIIILQILDKYYELKEKEFVETKHNKDGMNNNPNKELINKINQLIGAKENSSIYSF